jgi:hypothetical protein
MVDHELCRHRDRRVLVFAGEMSCESAYRVRYRKGFGDHYMCNMVVWAPAFALSEYDPSVKRALDELKQDLS